MTHIYLRTGNVSSSYLVAIKDIKEEYKTNKKNSKIKYSNENNLKEIQTNESELNKLTENNDYQNSKELYKAISTEQKEQPKAKLEGKYNNWNQTYNFTIQLPRDQLVVERSAIRKFNKKYQIVNTKVTNSKYTQMFEGKNNYYLYFEKDKVIIGRKNTSEKESEETNKNLIKFAEEISLDCLIR